MGWRTQIGADYIVHANCGSIIHPWKPDACLSSWKDVWRDGFIASLKVYVPFYLIPAIFRKKKPEYIIFTVIPSILRSSAFMASLGGNAVPFACSLRRIFGENSPLQIFLSGVGTGLVAKMIEEDKRMNELVIYAINQATESLYRILHIRGLVPWIKGGDVMIFVIACSLLSFLFHHHPSNLSNVKRVINFLTQDQPNGDEPKENICNHKGTCMKSTIVGTLRATLFGFAFRGSIGIVSNLYLKRMWNQPLTLLRRSVDWKAIRFGLFLGSFVISWKGIRCLLLKFFKVDHPIISIISGAISGLSIMFSRNDEMPMFFMSKAVEGMLSYLISKGIIKTSIPRMDDILFGLAVGILFYCSVLEPYNLRPSYWKFLHAISDGRYNQFESLSRGWKPEFFAATGFIYPTKGQHHAKILVPPELQ